jgi:hypothetical protein
MDGYKWAEEHGYHESAAKDACKELANELKTENAQLKELLREGVKTLDTVVSDWHAVVDVTQSLINWKLRAENIIVDAEEE